MTCSLPGFSVHGISQARRLEWRAISSPRGSSWCRDWTHISFIGRQILYNLSHQGSLWRLQISYFIKGPSLGIFWNFLLMIRFGLYIFVRNITEWYCKLFTHCINDILYEKLLWNYFSSYFSAFILYQNRFVHHSLVSCLQPISIIIYIDVQFTPNLLGGSPFQLDPEPFWYVLIIFEHVLALWCRIFQHHLVNPSSKPWNQPFHPYSRK